MWRKLLIAAMALSLTFGGVLAGGAEELHINGLGRIDLGKEVTVTDGSESQIGPMMIAATHKKGYGKTARAAMWSILTVPPGMNLYPTKPPYPYDSLHVYQIRKTDVRGTYSAGVFILEGREEDFFHGGNQKAAAFWKDAFREDAKRPTALFGMPKIRTEEFQALLDNVLKEKKDASLQVKLLTFVPWRAIKNEDGSYRWGQEARVIITNEKGLSFPMWISTTFYKEGDRYYLIEVNGSHSAAQQLQDPWLFGLYRMKRDGEENHR